jgi:pSer/pThr/pTyr-binding forkhead associated (FHA) protein
VTVDALATDETLLILKGAFLVLLYTFILLVARTATRDLRGAPQESIVLGAAEANALRASLPAPAASFVVVDGPGLRAGSTIRVPTPTIAGREGDGGIRLDGDEFASSRHARIEPRADGVWVEDLGSTNGTFVNGSKIATKTLVRAGDTVRIGQTELRLER